MKNPLRNEPKIVRYPCYMIMISLALLFDAVLFIQVADWLSIITFLAGFLFLAPAVILLISYGIFTIIRGLFAKKPKPKRLTNIRHSQPASTEHIPSGLLLLLMIGALLITSIVKLLYKLTQHYPFSLLFRDRIFHYDNRYLKSLSQLIETTAQKKLKKKFHIQNAEIDENFHTLFGKFKVRTKENTVSKLREELAKALHIDSDFIYVTKQDNGVVRISVPNDVANYEIET